MLYVFVEGPDDEQYINQVVRPIVGDCHPVQYATLEQKKVNQYIQSISCMNGSDYLFLGDADGKSIEQKRNDLIGKYNKLSSDKVYIVQYEIESWYYAGVTESETQKLKMKHYVRETDTLTKEQFYAKLPKKSDKKYIMSMLLSLYSLPLATTRNQSLRSFSEKINERTLEAVY